MLYFVLYSEPIAEGFAYALQSAQLQSLVFLKAIAVAHGLCKDNGYPSAIRSSLGDSYNGGTENYGTNEPNLDIDNELPTSLFAGFIQHQCPRAELVHVSRLLPRD